MSYTRLFAIVLALLCAASLCSCDAGRQVECREVLGAMMEAEVGLPAGTVYDMRAAEGEEEYLSESLLCALYGNGGRPTASDSWVDCALFLSVTEHPCELAVFYCDSRDAAIDTARLLSSRLNAVKSNKTSEQYSHVLSSASVTVDGNFVLMVISSDTQNALKIAKKRIG